MSVIEFSPDAVRPAAIALTSRKTASPSRIRWLVERIAAMERREVMGRLRTFVVAWTEVVRPVVVDGVPELDPTLQSAILAAPRAEAVARLTPHAACDAARVAEELGQGRFQLLGYPAVTLDRPIRYDEDPFTGRSWPARHGLLLDYRSNEIGDPKWAWELNRLQHIPLLFAVALCDGDGSALSCAVGDLDSWLSTARLGRGIGWSNGYEPALRAISMSLAVDALRSFPEHRGVARRAIGVLRHHVHWIRRYPSLFSSANNHRIGELVGLIVAAMLVPELDLDTRSELDELRLRCAEQYAVDGGHREQSFGYAVFTTELLVVAAGTIEARQGAAPEWLREVIARAAYATSLQLGESDPEPRYGDRDDGGPMLLSASGGRSGRSLVATVDYWLGRGASVGDLDSTAIWLFGDRYCEVPQRRAATSAFLDETGVVVLRHGTTTVTFDVGRHGFGSLAAHGHADALSITVARRGELVVGDPGTGSYFGNPEVRDAFRATRFHATVEVDEEDQGVTAGPFLWRSAPSVVDVNVDLVANHASASHDGYLRLDDPVLHTRTVALLEEELLLVCDVLKASGRHEYTQNWPLAPDAQVETLAGDRARGKASDVGFAIATASTSPVAVSLLAGSYEPFAGWWSDALEAVRPSPLLSCSTSQAGDAVMVTAIAMEGSAVSLEVKPLDNERFRLTAGSAIWMISLDGRGVASASRSSQGEPAGVVG